jgi:hypothetical protein
VHLISSSPSLLRRSAIVAGVAALGIAVTFSSSASASVASESKAKAVINTYKSWDGGSSVVPFGCPDTSTYGQVITIPAKKHKLTKFTFYMAGQAAAGQSMVVRGELYAWNGTMATGSAVAESSPQTLAFGDSGIHAVTFKTGSAKVKAGKQYVIFASIDKDYESCTGDYELSWASVDGSVYAGGDFAFQNNTGAEGNWTTVPWSVIPIDAAMKVFLA